MNSLFNTECEDQKDDTDDEDDDDEKTEDFLETGSTRHHTGRVHSISERKTIS